MIFRFRHKIKISSVHSKLTRKCDRILKYYISTVDILKQHNNVTIDLFFKTKFHNKIYENASDAIRIVYAYIFRYKFHI